MASAAAQAAEQFYRERQDALQRRASAGRAPLRPSRRSAAAPAFVPAPRPPRAARPELAAEAEALYPLPKLWTFSVSEIRALVLIFFVVAGVAFAIIQLSAMAAVTQSQINDLNRSIAQVNDDISNLKVDIEQAQDMQSVRTLAETELGMKEPSYDQYVFLADLPDPGQNFANTIKEKAYGEQPASQGADAGGAASAAP